MSRNARLGLVAAVVAAAVIGFIALRPNDDNDGGTTAATTVTTTSGTGTAGATTTAAQPTPAPFTTIRVTGGKPVGGVQSITVKKGDRIRFTVVDDKAENVHLHGYDVEKPVTPSKPAVYSLPADIDGIFEIELEDTSVQIGKLTVEP